MPVISGSGFLTTGVAPTYQIPFSSLAATTAMDLASIFLPDAFSTDRKVIRVRRVVISNPGAQTSAGLVNLQLGYANPRLGTGGTNITALPSTDRRGADPDLVVDSGATAHAGDATTTAPSFVQLGVIPVWVPGAVGSASPPPFDFGGPLNAWKCPTIPEGKALVLRHPGSTGASAMSGYIEITCEVESRLLPFGPLIPDALFPSVAHVWWNEGALSDTKGNAWTQNGTVPQVPRSGTIPAGAGPFNDVNYYSLGSGSDALDFAGDYSACFVFIPSASATSRILLRNGASAVAGYSLQLISSGAFQLLNFRAGANDAASTANASVASGVNVGCGGISGSTMMAKLNFGAVATSATGGRVAGTAQVAQLGDVTGAGFDGVILEAWFSSTAPTDALFTRLMTTVRNALNLSW